MKSRIFGLRALALIGVSGAAVMALCPSHAQADVISVQFTGSYTNTFANSSGDFGAGIYSANINGVSSSSGIICDDFNDEITAGETWNANAFQASSLAGLDIGDTLFGNTIGVTGYAEVATLVDMMFDGVTSYGGITGITQSELSSAIWDITTPGGISGLDATASALVAQDELSFTGNVSKATTFLDTQPDLWILTPDPLTGVGSGEPQEMWIDAASLPGVPTVPEPGSFSLALLGLASLGLMMVLRKRSGSRPPHPLAARSRPSSAARVLTSA